MQVPRSQLDENNKIWAINTIISWPEEDIEATDIKTTKLITMHGGYKP